jgi:predicted RNA-binding Zn-ribbon protein involved in translation (DUF1610 family)
MTEKPPTEKPVEEAHVHEPVIPVKVYDDLKTENATLKKQIAGYKMREIARNRRPAVEEKPAPPPAETHTEETAEAKPHYVGSWQQYCPDCGDKNPAFKDETVCKTCGMHLGAAAEVERLKACPNCGNKGARRL